MLDRLRVVLVSPRNPLNIGAAARAMSNFGFSRLRVVVSYELAFREARSAVGAPQILQEADEFETLAEAIQDCSLVVGTTAVGRRQLVQPLKRLEEGCARIRDHIPHEPAALVFGSEKRGLSKADLSHCHWLMRIPTRETNISMNLGQAVAVCLYELIRQDPVPDQAVTPHASAAQLERMTDALIDAMGASGYIKPGAENSSLQKARRMIRRMELSGEDAETWTGTLAKIVLALRRKKEG